MPYIFVKLVWYTDPIYPAIRFTPVRNENFSEVPLEIGDQFHIKLFSKRLCIGTETVEHGWITCIKNQKFKGQKYEKEGVQSERGLTNNYIQCIKCKEIDYFACRKICIGNVCQPSSKQAEAKCQPANTFVYLTYLGGEFKVGVSLGVTRRWLEQGSEYSAVVAKMPGLEARRIEQRLAKELNVKTQIRTKNKIRNFIPPPLDDISNEFELKINEGSEIIDEVRQFSEGERIENPSLINLQQYYGGDKINKPIQIVDLKPGEEFGGEIIAIKGSVIVVKQGIYFFALDTKTLISKTFDYLDRPAIVKGQTTLDDWF